MRFGNNSLVFQNTAHVNDKYVHNSDISVDEFNENSRDIECEDFMI